MNTASVSKEQEHTRSINQSTLSAPCLNEIVVGVDFDKNTDHVLQTARSIAERFESKLIALHTVPPALVGDTMGILQEIVQERISEAKQKLHTLINTRPVHAPAKWKILVCSGDPKSVIVEAARQHAADLVVVGSRGRQGLQQLLLGSVSEYVLLHGPCPVLIVGPDCETRDSPWKTILFATDLEDTGRAPAAYAASLALATGSTLLLLHVSSERTPAGSEMRSGVEGGLRERLNQLVAPEALNPYRHETLVAYGNPAETILAAAVSANADLIVLGTGKHGPGSDHAPWKTVSHIVRFARCPVLNVGAEFIR